MMGYGSSFGAVWMLLFWVFVIAGIVWLVLTVSRSQARERDASHDAVRILEDRLARGEIDAEEFRTRRAVLERGS